MWKQKVISGWVGWGWLVDGCSNLMESCLNISGDNDMDDISSKNRHVTLKSKENRVISLACLLTKLASGTFSPCTGPL